MCWSSISNYVMYYLCIVLVCINKVIHDAFLSLFSRVKLSTIVSHFSVPFPTLSDLFQSNLILWMINFHLSLQALMYSYFQIRKFRFVLHTRVLKCVFYCWVSLHNAWFYPYVRANKISSTRVKFYLWSTKPSLQLTAWS